MTRTPTKAVECRVGCQSQRNLLLIAGEMDDNVSPTMTRQLASALMDANKDFQLLIVPVAITDPTRPYAIRQKWDFFVRHLLGPSRRRL